jgi:hypothetical protein
VEKERERERGGERERERESEKRESAMEYFLGSLEEKSRKCACLSTESYKSAEANEILTRLPRRLRVALEIIYSEYNGYAEN